MADKRYDDIMPLIQDMLKAQEAPNQSRNVAENIFDRNKWHIARTATAQNKMTKLHELLSIENSSAIPPPDPKAIKENQSATDDQILARILELLMPPMM